MAVRDYTVPVAAPRKRSVDKTFTGSACAGKSDEEDR